MVRTSGLPENCDRSEPGPSILFTTRSLGQFRGPAVSQSDLRCGANIRAAPDPSARAHAPLTPLASEICTEGEIGSAPSSVFPQDLSMSDSLHQGDFFVRRGNVVVVVIGRKMSRAKWRLVTDG